MSTENLCQSKQEELRRQVAQSARHFYLNCLAEHPQETFYGVILDTDNDGLFINFRASSEESTRRSRINLWDMGAWEYEGGSKSVQQALEDLWALRDDRAPDRSWEMIHRRVFTAMAAGMCDFSRSEVVGLRTQDDRPVVLLFIGDPDYEMEPQLEEWARQLNPHARDLWFHKPSV